MVIGPACVVAQIHVIVVRLVRASCYKPRASVEVIDICVSPPTYHYGCHKDLQTAIDLPNLSSSMHGLIFKLDYL